MFFKFFFASSTKNSCLFKSTRRKAAQLLEILVENVTCLRAPLPLCSRVPDIKLILELTSQTMSTRRNIFFQTKRGYMAQTHTHICEMVSDGHSTSRTKHLNENSTIQLSSCRHLPLIAKICRYNAAQDFTRVSMVKELKMICCPIDVIT